MEQAGQIIAIGGGGFGRNPKHNKIERYILGQTGKDKPNVVFVPTASAEDKSYIVNFRRQSSGKNLCGETYRNF